VRRSAAAPPRDAPRETDSYPQPPERLWQRSRVRPCAGAPACEQDAALSTRHRADLACAFPPFASASRVPVRIPVRVRVRVRVPVSAHPPTIVRIPNHRLSATILRETSTPVRHREWFGIRIGFACEPPPGGHRGVSPHPPAPSSGADRVSGAASRTAGRARTHGGSARRRARRTRGPPFGRDDPRARGRRARRPRRIPFRPSARRGAR
jgi:hypothetical protein